MIRKIESLADCTRMFLTLQIPYIFLCAFAPLRANSILHADAIGKLSRKGAKAQRKTAF